MGSKTFGGILFVAYVHDHLLPHVHGFQGEMEVLVELLADLKVRQANRRDAVRPANAKRSDVRHILAVAADHAVELNELWEKARGTSPE